MPNHDEDNRPVRAAKNRRQPRTTGKNGKCISVMPDGTTRFFTPKAKGSRFTAEQHESNNGKWIIRDNKLR